MNGKNEFKFIIDEKKIEELRQSQMNLAGLKLVGKVENYEELLLCRVILGLELMLKDYGIESNFTLEVGDERTRTE